MTSNDAPRPDRGPRPGRRRALGRGPAAPPVTGDMPAGADPSASAAAEPPRPAPGTAPAPGPGEAAPAVPEESGSPLSSPTESRPFEGAAPAAPDSAPAPSGAASPAGARHAAQTALSGTRPGAEPTPPRAPQGTAPGEPEPAAAAVGATPDEGGADAADGGGEAGGDGSTDGEAAGGEADGDGVFKVRLANFEGPFDLLLQLISKHKMDVTEVALSKVTDEFMAHIRAMGPDWDLDQTTEFLVVAATLLDLKAARLLPAAEVEDEADLALLEARDLLFARLLQYRAYKQIAEIFNERLEAEARRYPRTVGLEPHHAELLPEVVISIGPEGFAKLAVKAMQPKPKPQVYVEHIHAPLVSVQEQAGIVVARLRELGEASFRVLVQDTEDTLTVVARFLALLELYREKAVELDQETALGDLLVRWTGGDGQTQPVVTDEFDRPPEAPKEEQKA
ncbi:segregation/condensation protein A [Streptomyces sp. NPDC003781]|uniref:segregation and condensation protein A n=1 Tax=Streptomyces sp. NPDC003781 TaxID=3364686 RepID=UPI0036855733